MGLQRYLENVTPPSSELLVLAADLVAMGLPAGETTLAAEASEMLRQAVGMPTLGYSRWKETFRGINGPDIQLRMRPVASVVSVSEEDGDTLTADADYTVRLRDAVVAAPNGLEWGLSSLENARSSWFGARAFVVDYWAGYILPGMSPVTGVPALPGDFSRMAKRTAVWLYSSSLRDPSIASMSKGGMAINFESRFNTKTPYGLPSDIAQWAESKSNLFV